MYVCRKEWMDGWKEKMRNVEEGSLFAFTVGCKQARRDRLDLLIWHSQTEHENGEEKERERDSCVHERKEERKNHGRSASRIQKSSVP